MRDGGYTCNECSYFQEISEAHPVGTCRRHAPFSEGKKRGSIDTENQFSNFFGTNSDWPQTHRDDWCGDFVNAWRRMKPPEGNQ